MLTDPSRNHDPRDRGGRHLAASAPRTTAVNPIAIIGGGVAGLACGCYLQMNGYQTEILETNKVVGGLCAAWDRGPYVFDGCLRWLVGTHPSSTLHQVWNELGAIAGRQIVNRDEFLRVEGANGEVLSLTADLDQFAQDCRRIAPEDAARIDRLVSAARRCAPLDPPLQKPLELMTGLEKMKLLLPYLPMLPVIVKWKKVEVAAYLAAYRNRFLREALLAVAGDPRVSALVLVMVLAFRSRRNTGYVAGGSRAFAEAIADRYTRLSGLLRYNAQVVSVIVAQDHAIGVRCADGTVLSAATVISCADGHTTIFRMLEGRYVNQQILDTYRNGDIFPGLIQASLGINRTFPEAPQALSLPLGRPLLVDDVTRHDRLEVAVVGAESGLCPAGKSVMTVRLPSRYEYWANLKNHHAGDYEKAKQGLLEQIIGILDRRFAGVAREVECTDLATPATFARFTGNWQGSYQGWLPTPRNVGRLLPRALPGLKDFYMAGHWVQPGGGLPWAALSGRHVAQMICARDGRVFTATEA